MYWFVRVMAIFFPNTPSPALFLYNITSAIVSHVHVSLSLTTNL